MNDGLVAAASYKRPSMVLRKPWPMETLPVVIAVDYGALPSRSSSLQNLAIPDRQTGRIELSWWSSVRALFLLAAGAGLLRR